jgi:hypothetical protein
MIASHEAVIDLNSESDLCSTPRTNDVSWLAALSDDLDIPRSLQTTTILLRCSLYCQGHRQPGSQCSALCINFLSGGLAYTLRPYGYRYPVNADCILMILRVHVYSLDKSHGWIVICYQVIFGCDTSRCPDQQSNWTLSPHDYLRP